MNLNHYYPILNDFKNSFHNINKNLIIDLVNNYFNKEGIVKLMDFNQKKLNSNKKDVNSKQNLFEIEEENKNKGEEAKKSNGKKEINSINIKSSENEEIKNNENKNKNLNEIDNNNNTIIEDSDLIMKDIFEIDRKDSSKNDEEKIKTLKIKSDKINNNSGKNVNIKHFLNDINGISKNELLKIKLSKLISDYENEHNLIFIIKEETKFKSDHYLYFSDEKFNEIDKSCINIDDENKNNIINQEFADINDNHIGNQSNNRKYFTNNKSEFNHCEYGEENQKIKIEIPNTPNIENYICNNKDINEIKESDINVIESVNIIKKCWEISSDIKIKIKETIDASDKLLNLINKKILI